MSIPTGKCPHCKKTLHHVELETPPIHQGFGGQVKWKGVSYICPFCKMILSVSIDPTVIAAEIKRANARK